MINNILLRLEELRDNLADGRAPPVTGSAPSEDAKGLSP
jgi:hypothetical protein